MRIIAFTAMAGATLLGMSITPVHAQAPILVDIAPCMALTSAADKHACYDRLEASARSAPATAGTPPVLPVVPVAPAQPAAPLPPAPAAQAVASFGNTTPAAARVLTSTDGQQELHDRIASLQEREPGRYLITLASGQVWYQSNSQRMRLRQGMEVRIYPSPLGGSYRMARDDGAATGFVQVERIK